MKSSYTNLLELLNNLPRSPRDLKGFIMGCPPSPSLPLHHVTWAFIASVNYHYRCRWAAEKVRACIPSDHAVRSACGKWDLHGISGWKCSGFKERARLTNEESAEVICLSEWKDPEIINTWGLITHISSQYQPGLIEQRLRQLFPDGRGLRFALRPLFRNTLIKQTIEGVSLCYRVAVDCAFLSGFVDLWRDPAQRVWLAAAIGDWPAAHATATDLGLSDIVELTFPRAADCDRQWVKTLQRAADRKLDDDVLCGLAGVSSINMDPYIHEAIEGESAVWTALTLIEYDPKWCPVVFRWLRTKPWHVDCDLLYRYADYLHLHNYRTDEVGGVMRAIFAES